MARLAATAVLLLSLLALANCRVLEAEPETVVATSDEQQGQADPAVLQETDAAEAIPSVPTVTVAEGVLRLPSNRRPCRHGFLHRHLRWVRHHGLSHRHGSFAGPGEARVVPAFLREEPRQAELEAVAEPDPDTRPDTDGEQKPFHGEEEVDGEENESVKAWKREMLRRFRGRGLRFHHLHHHHEHTAGEKDDSDVVQEQQNKAEGVAAVYANLLSRQFHHYHHGDHQEQENKEEGAADMQMQHVKLFSRHFHHHHGEEEQEQKDKEQGAERVPVELLSRPFHHHNHGDEEQEETERNHFFHHHHHHHHHQDSDNEVDEVEDLARKLSKAIMRRSFSRGGMRHHHHHGHAEEGGVKKWFKGAMNMNRF